MSTVPTARTCDDVIDLHFEDDNGTVRVTARDKDLMILSVNEAISACRAFADQIRFKTQFDSLLAFIGNWLKRHADKISAAVLTTRDAGLLLLIVKKSQQYERDFEDDVTDFDIQVANDSDFEMIDLSVMAIPDCQPDSVQAFLSKKMQLRYKL